MTVKIKEDNMSIISPKFIKLRLGSYKILHGFDENNKEIIEEIHVEEFSYKLVAVDRIQSVSEKYILTTYADNRWIYWEYEGGLANLENYFLNSNLLT